MRKRNLKFSIVIPVYNTSNFLLECLNSVKSQDYENVEMILINDGSTDASLAICRKFARENHNLHIKIMDQSNHGAAYARNQGLNVASGDYILFMDSDDYIEKGILRELMYFILSDNCSDLYFLVGLKRYSDGKDVLIDPELTKINYFEEKSALLTSIASLNKFPGSACTKAFKRSFLEKYRLRFDDEKSVNEDVDFMIRAILKAESIRYFSKIYYYYRQNRKDSLTAGYTAEKVDCLLKNLDDFIYSDQYTEFEKKCFIYPVLAYQYLIILAVLKKIPKTEQKKMQYNYKAYSWLLEYGRNWKSKLCFSLKKILGINITANLLSVYLYWRKE